MKQSFRRGLSFGLTSGIITTLGLIVGLNASTSDKFVVIAGILIIAIADALSDAFGIHMSEESQNNSVKEIWEATASTFFFKFIFALSFVIPFYLLELNTAIIASIFWGFSLITLFSYYLAQRERKNKTHIIFEHLTISILVIVATQLIGQLIHSLLL